MSFGGGYILGKKNLGETISKGPWVRIKATWEKLYSGREGLCEEGYILREKLLGRNDILEEKDPGERYIPGEKILDGNHS